MLRILTQLPKLRRQALASAIATLLLMTAAKASVAQAVWLAEMRSRIAASEFEAALAVVNQRLKQAPEDMEARGWRGRIQQWMGRLDEAEADYRAVLERHPQDTDILVGFADVLSRQGRTEEALEALEQARQADPSRTDVHVRRGQLLRRLERRPEARAAFQHALSLAPDDAAARKGLDSLQPEARHGGDGRRGPRPFQLHLDGAQLCGEPALEARRALDDEFWRRILRVLAAGLRG